MTRFGATRKTNRLDLAAVRNLIFKDIDKLLKSFDIEYERTDEMYQFPCPIHDGSDNQKGVSISLDKKTWRCWTRGCHETLGTDIFGFIRGVLSRRKGVDVPFSEVVKFIHNAYNVGGMNQTRLPTITNPQQDFCDLVKTIHVDQETLTGSTADGDAIQTLPTMDGPYEPSPYFISRGFSPSVLETFEVRDWYVKHTPMFCRSLIPIHNEQGNHIATIGRAIKEFIVPKYIFTKGFKKTHHLYNIHRAMDRAQELGAIFICEGQGDVWRLWESGVINAVGIFGKELSKQQKRRLLEMGITTLIVVTDNDTAGRESKVALQRELYRYFTLKFPRFRTKDIGELPVSKVISDILPQVKGYY